ALAAVPDGPEPGAHPLLRDHGRGYSARLLDVRAGPRGVLAVHVLLCGVAVPLHVVAREHTRQRPLLRVLRMPQGCLAYVHAACVLRCECTARLAARPRRSGLVTGTCRSKRPGRSSAGSSTSGRLVAAMRMTVDRSSKPSISTSSWLSVCSRSSWPPPVPEPRCRPTASISSTNTMHGEFCLAFSNRSRTREAPTPTNISTKSEPEIE